MCTGNMKENARKDKAAVLLTGRGLDDVLKEYDRFLFDEFLPFVDRFVVDHQYGGFACNTDYFGRNITKNKRTWYDGRGIWVYSFLYQHVKKDPHYLEIATKAVKLVLSARKKGDVFWPWSYDQQGKPLEEYPGDIYGNLFVAEGLVAYSQAVESQKYWEHAREILLESVTVYDQAGYTYKLEYTPDPSVPVAERVLGHWMIMLRLATNLLRIREDQEVLDIADRCIHALMVYHYNPECKLMVEVLDHDNQQMAGVMSQFVYIGHAIESLWMVMDEAIRRKDEELFNRASERFKFHVEVAWDDVYGGVFHCLNHVDENKWLLDKVLWAQEEVLIGCLILIEHRGDSWAIEWFDKMYKYVLKSFPVRAGPYNVWRIGGNRRVQFEGSGNRIENFHHPRHLMLNKLAIERLINKQNRLKQDRNNDNKTT